MRRKIPFSAVFLCFILCLHPTVCFANSSWHWLTASPKKVLPFAVILTLLIEIFAVVKFAGVKNIQKASIIITLANLLSFLAPCLERANRFIATSGVFSIGGAFDKGPYYIVLSGFLLLTLVIELPTGFFLLRKDASSTKHLALAILIANLVTTGGVAIAERLICIGQW
jgi:hypothetical protein